MICLIANQAILNHLVSWNYLVPKNIVLFAWFIIPGSKTD